MHFLLFGHRVQGITLVNFVIPHDASRFAAVSLVSPEPTSVSAYNSLSKEYSAINAHSATKIVSRSDDDHTDDTDTNHYRWIYMPPLLFFHYAAFTTSDRISSYD